jgi:hypothetical protein
MESTIGTIVLITLVQHTINVFYSGHSKGDNAIVGQIIN